MIRIEDFSHFCHSFGLEWLKFLHILMIRLCAILFLAIKKNELDIHKIILHKDYEHEKLSQPLGIQRTHCCEIDTYEISHMKYFRIHMRPRYFCKQLFSWLHLLFCCSVVRFIIVAQHFFNCLSLPLAEEERKKF